MDQVSIIIPTYNRKKLVKNAVISSLMQTYPKTEIIVIDDNSDYEIYDVLRDFNEKITIIKNKRNIGPIATLNKGIKESKGNYITILNDDDIFHQKKIERQIKIFNKDKNIGLVYCPELRKIGNKFIYKPLKKKNNHWIRLIHQNPIIVTPLIKRECFTICGDFDKNMGYQGDRDLWYRINKKFYFYFDNYPSYIVYKPNINRLSIQMEYICKSKKSLYEKHKNDFTDQNKLFSDLHYELAYIYLIFGHYKNFLKHFKISLEKNPLILKKFIKPIQELFKYQYRIIDIDKFINLLLNQDGFP